MVPDKAKVMNQSKKSKIRERIIEGARNYKNRLMNKTFGIVAEDGVIYQIHFYKNDFKHLTGVTSNLNDSNFFNECVCGRISDGNIDTIQHYNWSNINHKTQNVKVIHELLYKDCSKTIAIDSLVTHCIVFPLALKSTQSNMCVGFVSSQLRARSMRKASNSYGSSPIAEKKVIAIFGKPTNALLYNELVYISDVKNVYDKCPGILEKIEPSMKDRFEYILPKEEESEQPDSV